MKSFCVERLLKGFIGMSLFSLLLFGSSQTAKAESVTDLSGSDVEITQSDAISESDMVEIMSNLEGREIINGDNFVIGDYQYSCEVIIVNNAVDTSKKSTTKSTMNALASTASSTTSSYTAYCNVIVSSIFNEVCVAGISHTVTVINYSTGLVHISSGQVTATPTMNNWSAYCYGYTITNTNGSSSSSFGMARLYNITNSIYIYYRCSASVTPGNSPSFSFTQV